MKLLVVQERINELMSQFVTQVRGASAMGRTDINHISEVVLIPIFSEVFELKGLKNLNTEESYNFPAIDLGDKTAGLAIQVTSTTDSEKIKETLRKFVNHKLYEQYSHLQIYILTEKQKSYSRKTFDEIIGDRFKFNPKEDILDYRDVLGIVSGFPIGRSEKILSILESNINSQLFNSKSRDSQIQVGENETVTLNLLEVFFPGTLYVAELLPGISKQVSRKFQPKPFRNKRSKRPSKRDLVREALTEMGEKFAVDWEVFENKLITFHDLRDENLPISRLIDVGAAEPIESEDFFTQDINQENVFKSLLRKCLQQFLYSRRMTWQNDKHLFIFTDKNGEDVRSEKWKGKVSGERIVFERTYHQKDPTKVWYCKHLAFEPQFRFFDKRWYLTIRPDWFFSYDGYKESFYSAEKLSWLKRRENNDQIHHQLLFINYFLTHEPHPELFDVKPQTTYRFLSFGKLLTFDNSAHLPDKEWNPTEQEDDSEAPDRQMVMDL